MNQLLIVCSLILIGSCQPSAQKLYSVPFSGFDVISNPDLLSSQVSYCQNLVWNSATNQIWFTADESSPNLQLAEFDPQGGNHSFWLNVKPPMAKGAASPFVSLALSPKGDSLTGSAFPSFGSYQGLTLQTVQTTGFGVNTFTLEGYEFFGITYGKQATSGVAGSLVYVAGWVNINAKNPDDSKKGFVVARGRVPTAPGPLTIDPQDITPPLLHEGCYDIFTTQLKPQMYQIDSYLVVIIPGRCQTILRFKLPDVDSYKFGQLPAQVYSPGRVGERYIAASSFDPVTGNVFFAVKSYNQPDTDVEFLNGKAPQLIVTASIKMPTEESSVYLIPGAHSGKDFVYVISPLQGVISELEVNTTSGTFKQTGYANIPQELNKAQSFLFIKDTIYLSTYEPSCKLARLPIGNFCPYWCGDNAFCNAGICTCLPNYSPLWGTDHKLDGCELTTIHEEIIKEQQIVGTAAVMGVLFVITTIVAFFGWRAWYAGRSSPQAAALVHEYNRPL